MTEEAKCRSKRERLLKNHLFSVPDNRHNHPVHPAAGHVRRTKDLNLVHPYYLKIDSVHVE